MSPATTSDGEEYHIDSAKTTEQEYTAITETLTDALNTVNPTGTEYNCRGEQVGWKNISGNKQAKFKTGKGLLEVFTPSGSQWQADITITSDSITIELYHHDSPTGETHTITKAT